MLTNKYARRFNILLLNLILLFGQTSCLQPSGQLDATIVQNPNPRVPLAAIVRFDTAVPVSTRIEIDDGDRTWQIDFGVDFDPVNGLPILGLRAGRAHTLNVSALDQDGNLLADVAVLSYTTPELPLVGKRFPGITVNSAQPDRMEPGITLLSVRRNTVGRNTWDTPRQREFVTGWSLLLGLNSTGEVVWYYESDKRIAGIDQLQNGNLMFHLTDARTVEMDLLGNPIRQWYAENRPQGPAVDAIPIADAQTLHHQPHQIPSGNFLAFTASGRPIENYYTSEYDIDAPRESKMVMGDAVIEFAQDGEVVWRWDAFDYLDPFRVGYGLTNSYWSVRGFPGFLDWTHGNGVGYDRNNDLIVFSLRHQDAIVAVERESSDIRWILGEHSDWPEHLQDRLLEPVGNIRWPYHGHNPRVTDDGTIMLFDNGVFQARPFHGEILPSNETYSRGVEYRVDTDAMTVQQIWASDHELGEESCNSWAMGDAHRLPKTENYLVIYAFCVPMIEGLTYDVWDNTSRHVDDLPAGGRVKEFSAVSSDVVFDIEINDPDDILQWEIYGGLRIPGFYLTR